MNHMHRDFSCILFSKEENFVKQFFMKRLSPKIRNIKACATSFDHEVAPFGRNFRLTYILWDFATELCNALIHSVHVQSNCTVV